MPGSGVKWWVEMGIEGKTSPNRDPKISYLTYSVDSTR
jgi:hypothetical protein